MDVVVVGGYCWWLLLVVVVGGCCLLAVGGKEERSGCSTKNKNPTRKCGDKIIRTAWRISNMDLLETTPAFSYCEKFSFL